MRNKQYRLTRTYRTLCELKKKGVKSVCWRLSKNQLDFLRVTFDIEPYLYAIKTKRFVQIQNIPYKILKDLHYSAKSGKKEIVRKLNSKEIAILEQQGIQYYVCKYTIHLCGWDYPKEGGSFRTALLIYKLIVYNTLIFVYNTYWK